MSATNSNDIAIANCVAGAAQPSAPLAIKAVVAATIGNMLEWYDFAVFGYFATTIAKLFFPAANPTTSLLLTFATFGVGFLMRPLGALIIGIYGDLHGRKNALMLTMGLMALGTGLIGVLPTFGNWGIAAALCLLFARLIQGFSAGGESGGAIAFIVEYAPPRMRGLIGSLQQSTVALGLLCGSLTATVLSSTLTPEQLDAGGWRIPFLLGILVAPVGIYLRSQLQDTPAYEAAIQSGEVVEAPLMLTLKAHWKSVLRGAGMTLLWTVAYYACFSYLPTFAINELGFAAKDALFANTIALTAVIVLTPLAGALSDKIGRRPLLIASTLSFGLASYPLLLWLEGTPQLQTLIVVGLVFAVALAMYNGPGPAALSELFPTSTRYTGLSIGYNVSAAVFAGFAPFVSTYLVAQTGQKAAPAYFIIACAIMTLVTLLTLRESFKDKLQ